MKYTIPEFELSYAVKGNQNAERTLVFLNGIFHGEPSWIKQSRFAFFKKEHKQVFIDYPGCGDSRVFSEFSYDQLCVAIAGLLEELRLPNITLVGYSFGGILSLELAKRYPHLISQLVMVNSAIDISMKGKKMMANVKHMLETDVPLATIFQGTYSWFFSDDYLEQLEDFQTLVVQRYVEYNHNRHSVISFLNAIGDRENVEPLPLTIPALLVGTEGDFICPPKLQKALIDSNTTFEWTCLPLNTHAANIEAHALVNQSIRTFLESQYD
ncbi:alpha/beta fold hydrolase [Vibrio penaeicida]|uniref:alpha/beta fold hydrolase n=1 Tax=Vibrio penaeicida TaxID=104609 RepID=UPI000CE9DD31|nr:alpha/beta hydrolase [Vibrio penaeicida]